MKNKIIVDIFVPAINENFNIFIPVNKTVGEVIKIINQSINEITKGTFPISNSLSLIDLNTGVLYDTNFSIKSNKLQNGSRLVLI